jgi:hypothetical protein
MSASAMMARGKNTLEDTLIPPRIVENGGLITGNKYDYTKNIMPEKIAVPPGENGTFLQADSTTETGLKWSKIPIPDEMDEIMKTAMIEELQFQRKQISALKMILLSEIIKKIEEHKTSITSPYFIVKHNGIEYKIPYNPSMTVNDVIDYLNTQYYLTVINEDDCVGINLFFDGKKISELQQPISNINIQNESVITTVCSVSQFKQLLGPHGLLKKGGGKRRITKTKRRNKSYRK